MVRGFAGSLEIEDRRGWRETRNELFQAVTAKSEEGMCENGHKTTKQKNKKVGLGSLCVGTSSSRIAVAPETIPG